MAWVVEQVLPIELKRSGGWEVSVGRAQKVLACAVVPLARVVSRQKKWARALPFEQVAPAPRRCRGDQPGLALAVVPWDGAHAMGGVLPSQRK